MYWDSWYNPTLDSLANAFSKFSKYNIDKAPLDEVITETIDKVL